MKGHSLTGIAMSIIRTEKRERSFAGKMIKWAFIGFNFLMVVWVILGFYSVSKIQTHSVVEQIGTGIGAAVGFTFVLMLWALGDLILGVLVLVTRGDKVVVEEKPAFSAFASDSTTPSVFDLDRVDQRIAQLKAQATPSPTRPAVRSSPGFGKRLA
jgi:hypothetical protein